MRADIDRAVQIVRAATEFDWAWTTDDLPTFTRTVGWQLADLGQRSPMLITDLEVNRTDAAAFLDNAVGTGPRSIKRIWFYYTDVVLDDPSVKPLLSDAFDELAQRVFELVGQRPAGWWWRDPSRRLRWDLPNLVLKLSVSDRSGNVSLVNPAFQDRQDEIDRRIDPEANPDSVWPPEIPS